MKRLMALVILAVTTVGLQAQVVQSYSMIEVGVPGRAFRLVTGDTAITIDTSYISVNRAPYGFTAFITVEQNPVRMCYNLLPSWRNMVKDTLNYASVVKDTTAGLIAAGWPTAEYIKLTATGHHLLDSMMVTFDSLERYTDTVDCYKVVFSDSANWFIASLPLGDTVIADTVPSTCGYVRTADFGNILPEGYVDYIHINKKQIRNSHWCNADSAQNAVVKFNIHVR